LFRVRLVQVHIRTHTHTHTLTHTDAMRYDNHIATLCTHIYTHTHTHTHTHIRVTHTHVCMCVCAGVGSCSASDCYRYTYSRTRTHTNTHTRTHTHTHTHPMCYDNHITYLNAASHTYFFPLFFSYKKREKKERVCCNNVSKSHPTRNLNAIREEDLEIVGFCWYSESLTQR